MCVLTWRHPASVIQSLSFYDTKSILVGMNTQRYGNSLLPQHIMYQL